MKYSRSLWWFENVRWAEENCFVDCLVDISDLDFKEGYFLVEEGCQLNIYPRTEVEDKVKHPDFKILGKAKKWIVDFDF